MHAGAMIRWTWHLLGLLVVVWPLVASEPAAAKRCDSACRACRQSCTSQKDACVTRARAEQTSRMADCAPGHGGASCRRVARKAFSGARGGCGRDANACRACCKSTNGGPCVTTTTVSSSTTTTLPLRTMDMTFQHVTVSTKLPTPVVLDGLLHVSSAGGLQGSIVFTYGSSGTATLNAGVDGSVTITMGAGTFDLLPTDTGSVSVNGVTRAVAEALGDFVADSESGSDAGQWTISGQATLVIAALVSTDAWAANTRAIIAAEGTSAAQGVLAVIFTPQVSVSPGWCKVTAYGAAGAITTIATAGCAALTASCAVGTSVTIGGLSVPCVALIGLCAGGVYAGQAAAYELTLSLWSPTPTTTTTLGTTTTTLGQPRKYVYQGNPLCFPIVPDAYSCQEGVGECQISGWFVLATPLAADLHGGSFNPLDVTQSVTSFSFTDGVHTITDKNAASPVPGGQAYQFKITETDATGNITGWALSATAESLGADLSSGYVPGFATCSAVCASIGTSTNCDDLAGNFNPPPPDYAQGIAINHSPGSWHVENAP